MTEQRQKTINYRISAAPVIGADGDVYAIPGNTPGAGAAQPILPYIRDNYSVSTGNVVGILISCGTGGSGNHHVHIRTSTIGLGAGEAGKGISIPVGQSLYLPKPTDDWAAECPSEFYVALFY
jgi:hypothetical protein